MQKLSNKELKELTEGEDADLYILASRILRVRKARARNAPSPSHRLNYPIEEVLEDFVERRKGKILEARRQLKKRFDGQEHSVQERIMLAFMEHGGPGEREFIYEKLYGEEFHDHQMAKVIIKRCPRGYLLKHLDELMKHGNYANLCIRTGMTPEPGRLSPQTYLWVLKSIGGQPLFREGERAILGAVRDYLYEHQEKEPVDCIYGVPYVTRMMGYLGEMGLEDEIIALDAFDRRMGKVPQKEWAAAVIKAIEEKFDFPEYVAKDER